MFLDSLRELKGMLEKVVGLTFQQFTGIKSGGLSLDLLELG